MSTLKFDFVDFEDGTRIYPDEESTSNKQRDGRREEAFWTGEQTGWMIDKFVEYMNEIGPTKKFRNKRSMWEHMSKEMYEEIGDRKTYDQLQNRYKTLLRRKRNSLKKNEPLVSILEATKPIPGKKREHKTFVTSEANYSYLAEDTQSQESYDTSSNKQTYTVSKYEQFSDLENDEIVLKKRKTDESPVKKEPSLSEVVKDTLLEIDRRRARREEERERRREIRHQETLELIRALFCSNSEYN